jgi:hypothetical protein
MTNRIYEGGNGDGKMGEGGAEGSRIALRGVGLGHVTRSGGGLS